MENSGASKTLGRTFGYLLLADQPKTLDEISKHLMFSKATASLTIRQGLTMRIFEKVSITGERKARKNLERRADMTQNTLMRLNRITKTYHMGEVTVNALKETTLEVYQGEILVILGPSGSGKSTLLNIMGGMDLPTTGEVLFGDSNLGLANDDQLTSYRRNEIGFVFQIEW